MFLGAVISACREKAPCFDYPIKRLMGKTWVEIKRCENDSCFTKTDSLYSYFPKISNTYSGVYRDTASMQCYSYHRREDGNIYIDTFTNFQFFCDPPLKNNNTFQAFFIYKSFKQRGEIIFISHSEFVLWRHLISVDKKYHYEIKDYFKLVKSQQEIPKGVYTY